MPTKLLEPKPTDKVWSGDIGTCDICHTVLKGDFFDSRTFSGPWATLCLPCWKVHTPQKTGTDIGQHYKQRTDNKWVKVAG